MKKIWNVLSAVMAPILAWLFPVVFLYARNAKEVAISEIINPAAIYLLCALVLILIGKLIFREWQAAALFSVLSGIFLTNFDVFLNAIQKIMPQLRYWHLLYITVVLVVVVCRLLKRLALVTDGLSVARIVFCGLFAFNIVTAIPTIVQRISDMKIDGEQVIQNSERQEKGRNIYYILCDEYASFTQLESEFGFDNAEFKEQLQQLGFNISESSRNESYQTVTVMANVMQLDYLATDKSTSVELENLTKGGVLQKIVLENGYELRGVGKTEWLGIDGTVEYADGATTADGSNMSNVILMRSFLKPFVARDYVAEAEEKLKMLESINGVSITPDSALFTMCYFDVPHHPYYFDEDGNMNPPAKWTNDETGKNNDAYIGMVKLTNKYMLSFVKRIIADDPNAIIILASDHGNRFGNVAETSKYNILNTLYYAGETMVEFEGLSSVNTMRMILNREFGLNMEYVDLP